MVDDLNKYEIGTIHDELKWVDVSLHASKIANSESKIVFMTPSELQDAPRFVEEAKQGGYEIVTIPENLKEKMSGQVDIKGNSIVDLSNFQKNWNDSFSFTFVTRSELNNSEIELLDKIPTLFELIGGKPKVINEVKISETMRIDENTYSEAVGLWIYPDIIIKRSQLQSESSFLGTLLHEVAHAKSSASDISLRFEQELTNLLGQIAQKQIMKKEHINGTQKAEKKSLLRRLFS
jgi:hypothetical protein